MGEPLQTVALPNCPFVTSVQFAPLSFAVLIGYGRCQAPAIDQAPQYAVLRCIAFAPSSPSGARRQLTEEVAIFSVDSTDESNVALFHPHPHACAHAHPCVHACARHAPARTRARASFTPTPARSSTRAPNLH